MPQRLHWLQWDAPYPRQKLPLPMICTPTQLHHFQNQPTHWPKWHPDPICHFYTIHRTDRRTDRPIYWLTNRLDMLNYQ